MLTNQQVQTLTVFLQVMTTWLIVLRCLKVDTSKLEGKFGALTTRFLFGLAGLMAILIVARVWPTESSSSDPGLMVIFVGLTTFLYVCQICFVHLSTTWFLKTLGWVSWILTAAMTFIYCDARPFPGFSDSASWAKPIALAAPSVTVVLLALFFAVFTASDAVELFMQRWSEFSVSEQGLPFAGRWIGRFERFLVVCCLLANQPAGIAIVVTAKGILRFGEIKDEKDQENQRRLVEYILIGSMLSYSIALTIGWIAGLLLPVLQYR